MMTNGDMDKGFQNIDGVEKYFSGSKSFTSGQADCI
jgi:hypothetical protein